MGRGRSSSSGGGSRGSSSRSSGGHWGRSHTTVIVGGHGHYHHGSGSPVVGIVVGIIFCLVGLFCVFGGFGKVIDSSKYETVQAECILNEKSNGWYYTTYEYTVNGVEYTNRSMEGWEFPEDVGKVVEIYYLKSDPNEIWEKKPATVGEGLIIVFVGLVCAGMGAIPMVICIKEMKKSKQNSGKGDSAPEKTQETHNKCPYCGARYKKTSDSCPKCGASKVD
jgi:hypothetical protein